MINLQYKIFTSEIDIIEWDWNKFKPHLFTNNVYCQVLMFCCHCLHCISPFHKNWRSQILVPSPYLPELYPMIPRSGLCGTLPPCSGSWTSAWPTCPPPPRPWTTSGWPPGYTRSRWHQASHRRAITVSLQGLGIKDFKIIKGIFKLDLIVSSFWFWFLKFIKGVVLEYFTNALGPALTHEAAVGWTNFLDLMIEVVKETAKGDWSKRLPWRSL